jgi:GntR family transcriptional regulator
MPDASDEAPLYRRTYLLLRQRILAGHWAKGAMFPTEQELCEDLSISRVTVRRALELLAEDKLLRRFQGRGTIVVPSVTPQPVHASISGQIDNAVQLGRATTVRLLAYGTGLPPPATAAAFGVAAGTVLHRSVRVRARGKRPISHITSWLLPDVAARIKKADLMTSRPILAMLQGFMRLQGADQVISATLADAEVAALLRVPVGSPLLEVTRSVACADPAPNGRTVMVSTALYNPTLYQYRLRLDDPSTDLWEGDHT